VVVACSCGVSNDPAPKYTTPGDQIAAELAAEGIGSVSQDVIQRVLEVSKKLTLQTRSMGIDNMVIALKEDMNARGLNGAPLDDVQDFNLGATLPGVGEYDGPKTDAVLANGPTLPTGGADSTLGANNPNAKQFQCPAIEAIGDAKSCVQLVDAITSKVTGAVDVAALQALAKKLFEEDAVLKGQSQAFKDYAMQYLNDLALDIHKYGIRIAAIRAEYALRKAGVCDNKIIDGKEIAKLRGIEEGEQIIRELVGKKNLNIAPQGGECLKIGPKGPAADAMIKQATEKFLKNAPPMCPDMSNTNPAMVELTKLRMDGIKRGIDAHTTTIWVATFRNGKLWQGAEYVVANIDGCQAKDQIKYTTSPLVLDLDNDGLELTTARVRFDLRATGQPQQVTWAGKREGFLVLDLNGDGRITSGRELFGDRTLCGAERCADGAAALAQHDSNRDGKVDARDAVFSQLKVWVDANGDGRSEASELKSLADHGVKAISLKVTSMNERLPGGRLSLSLAVETVRGTRTAYDVWFDNLAAPGFSAPLH
jgi:hypothetical protein